MEGRQATVQELIDALQKATSLLSVPSTSAPENMNKISELLWQMADQARRAGLVTWQKVLARLLSQLTRFKRAGVMPPEARERFGETLHALWVAVTGQGEALELDEATCQALCSKLGPQTDTRVLRVRLNRSSEDCNVLEINRAIEEFGQITSVAVQDNRDAGFVEMTYEVTSAGTGWEELLSKLDTMAGCSVVNVNQEVQVVPGDFEGHPPDDKPVRTVLEQQLKAIEVISSESRAELLPALWCVLRGVALYVGNETAARAASQYHEKYSHLSTANVGKACSEAKRLITELMQDREREQQLWRVRSEAQVAEDEKEKTSRTIRIAEARVDALVNLAGEMVVTCNALSYIAKRLEKVCSGSDGAAILSELKGHQATMKRLVDELQDVVMNMKLLPFSYAFQKIPRMVRDLSRQLGKEVSLTIEGEQTEVDKSVLQAISEPLVHLVRNALDHGIELPEERVRLGKPRQGRLVVRAVRRNNSVALEVEDDGKGIEVEKVRQRAVAMGLIQPEEASLLPQEKVIEFIFVPGFSTSDRVTDVSGRGIGMDAVKSAVEKLGGRISVWSEPGSGCKFSIDLPVTLTTVRVLVIAQGQQKFGIPFESVRETAKIETSRIRTIKGKKVLVLRHEVIPVIDLAEYFQAMGRRDLVERACAVVLTSGLALLVDNLVSQEDVVVKPLDCRLPFDPCFAGSAILGDGDILLVLDPQKLRVA